MWMHVILRFQALVSRLCGFGAGSLDSRRSLDKHLRGGMVGVRFSSKQLVAAEMSLVRTGICLINFDDRMEVGSPKLRTRIWRAKRIRIWRDFSLARLCKTS